MMEAGTIKNIIKSKKYKKELANKSRVKKIVKSELANVRNDIAEILETLEILEMGSDLYYNVGTLISDIDKINESIKL